MMQTGDVFWAFIEEIYPPKPKMGVCVCVESRWFFLISSENRKMYDCIALLRDQHPFLKHDSFLSCSRVFTPDNRHMGKKIGQISQEVMQRLYERVEASEILETQKIVKILASLRRGRR
jgi:hypothetical protein